MAEIIENGRFLKDRIGECIKADENARIPDIYAQGAAAFLYYRWPEIEEGLKCLQTRK